MFLEKRRSRQVQNQLCYVWKILWPLTQHNALLALMARNFWAEASIVLARVFESQLARVIFYSFFLQLTGGTGMVRQQQGQLSKRKLWRGHFAKVSMPHVSFRLIWDLFAPSIQVVVLLIHIFQVVGLICTLMTSCRTYNVYSSFVSFGALCHLASSPASIMANGMIAPRMHAPRGGVESSRDRAERSHADAFGASGWAAARGDVPHSRGPKVRETRRETGTWSGLTPATPCHGHGQR
jgi:hypothetical protein